VSDPLARYARVSPSRGGEYISRNARVNPLLVRGEGREAAGEVAHTDIFRKPKATYEGVLSKRDLMCKAVEEAGGTYEGPKIIFVI